MTATPQAFVIGDPISHSLSPKLHNHWLQTHAINGNYQAVHIRPDELTSFVAELKNGSYMGGNITIPHKKSVMQMGMNAGKTATILQAANTLWFDGNEIHIDNTDAYGFTENMNDFAPQWKNQNKAIILGAGGAAVAILWAIVQAGYRKIVIINRTQIKAQQLCQRIASVVDPKNSTSFYPAGYDQLDQQMLDCDLLVNTTAMGMVGQAELKINLDPLPPTAIVSDIVYNPLQTTLLKKAAKRGLQTVDGLGMLIHQAVPGFERWFGIRPQVTDAARSILIKTMVQLDD